MYSETGVALPGSRTAVDVYDWLVPMNFPIADLQIEVAIWVRADPGLVVHSGTLSAKIGKRHKHSAIAGYTLRPGRRLQRFLRF